MMINQGINEVIADDFARDQGQRLSPVQNSSTHFDNICHYLFVTIYMPYKSKRVENFILIFSSLSSLLHSLFYRSSLYMACRGRTRSTWEADNNEDNGLSESSSGNNLSSRSPSVETVVETDDEATDHLSLKLNRLTDKLCRYESHKYFITKCLEGFWSLNPSIGNHDEFLKNWYEDVHNFLLNKMQDTINFYDKTITETKANINQTEDYGTVEL